MLGLEIILVQGRGHSKRANDSFNSWQNFYTKPLILR